ncbi:MAG: hypothetical protein WCG62_01190, partial [Actinomycetes bacterium]
SIQAVIARNVSYDDREAVVSIVGSSGIRANEMEQLFVATNWPELSSLGPEHRDARLGLLRWSCDTLATLERGGTYHRFELLALGLPATFINGDEQGRSSS